MILIDIGNKIAQISNGDLSISQRTSVLFGVGNTISIGKDLQEPKVMYDLLMLLGAKYQNEQFSDNTKFYIHNFQRAKNGKIQLILDPYEGIKHRRLHVQTVLALYIKKMIKKFIAKGKKGFETENNDEKLEIEYENLLKSNKFYFLINGGSTHPHRYALKQACEILGISSPIFASAIHSHVLSFYAFHKKAISPLRSQIYLAISIGDRNTTACVYRVHSNEQKIVEAISTKSLGIGGYHFTKVFAIYIYEKIKQQKRIDIHRNSIYMSTLFLQCQRAKINLSEPSKQILQKEAFIRVADLPDDSSFGKMINQTLFEKIIQEPLQQILLMVQQMICANKGVSKILLHGNGSQMLQFRERLQKIQKKYEITQIVHENQKYSSIDGYFLARNMEITMFDISEHDYIVTGEEGFKQKFVSHNEGMPTRNCQTIRFPSGQLEFNLKVLENGEKVAHFLLESRPNEPTFGLNFELDRNKLVDMFVKTSKGKIHLPSKFQGLSEQQMEMQKKIINDFT